MQHFSDVLAAALSKCGNPVVVGLDPRLDNLPHSLTVGIAPADLAAGAQACETFCKGVVDVVAPLVPAVKIQAAFFELWGVPGCAAMQNLIHYATAAGLIVILDGKRNDIGSTAIAYAEAYLGRGAASPWGADALTVSPYLGADALTPFIQVAARRGAGVFVLVKTSNPGGGLFQDLMADGRPIYEHVARFVETQAVQTIGESGFGAVGAVVGATYPYQLSELRASMPHSWFLVPGYGMQGGTAKDVAGAFDQQGQGALVNSSRNIIFAWERKEFAAKFGVAKWQLAVEAATKEMVEQLRADTPAGKLGRATP